MTLATRIAKLEAKLTPAIPARTVVFLSWATPNEFRRLQHGDRYWDRQDGESEDDFKARAIGDTGTDRPVTLLFAT
ncbi:MAG: hypothetical protein IPO43_21420 [Rhodoferax sp.]|nr:hypothetical protein [Rhodoferax sp.]